MNLLFTMLPFYLFGNLHCIGMCGPLVMMIGRHRYRYLYFFGRLASFTLAGTVAGGLGAVLALTLKTYQIPAFTSFLFGILLIIFSFSYFCNWSLPGNRRLQKRLSQISQRLSLLILKDKPWPTFLFGFFTVILPCGQTLIVFSACALYGDSFSGFLNGAAFALLTSPSLFLAMKANSLLSPAKKHYNKIMGSLSLLVGVIALCRGMAELEWIPHWILNPNASPEFHLVLF